jgi:hypothetical protein
MMAFGGGDEAKKFFALAQSGVDASQRKERKNIVISCDEREYILFMERCRVECVCEALRYPDYSQLINIDSFEVC